MARRKPPAIGTVVEYTYTHLRNGPFTVRGKVSGLLSTQFVCERVEEGKSAPFVLFYTDNYRVVE